MNGARLMWLAGCLAMPPVMAADFPADRGGDRIAAHFEPASSRLRPEDAELLSQFVSRVKNTPGARLTVLVPIATEPARARFVAARVMELERHVEAFSETAEFHSISASPNGDVLWLALERPPSLPGTYEDTRIQPDAPAKPVDVVPLPSAPLALTAPASEVPASPVTAADLRLTDWVIRGVKRPAQGPASAYVARTSPGAIPREIVERQVDREFGFVKEIGASPEGGWIVRTEIGWIGQGSPLANP